MFIGYSDGVGRSVRSGGRDQGVLEERDMIPPKSVMRASASSLCVYVCVNVSVHNGCGFVCLLA